MGIKRGNMKFPYFKSMLALGALVVAWNCSDTTAVNPNFFQEDARVLQTENGNLYITADNQVKSEDGQIIGTYDEVTGTIVSSNGFVIYENVNKDDLEDTTLEYTVSSASTSDSGNGDSGENGGNGTNNGGTNNPTQSANSNTTQSTNSNNNTTPVNLSKSDCSTSGEYVGCLTQTVVAGSEIEPIVFNTTNYPSFDDWSYQDRYVKNYDGSKLTIGGKTPSTPGTQTFSITLSGKTYKFTFTTVAGGSNVTTSNSSQTNSSAKQSSASQPKSSASVQSSSSRPQSTGPSLLPKVIGQEKDGYATRYWDSCKPHCAWSGKGGPVARTCHKDGSKAGVDEKSACDGGPAGTCTDQTPQIVNDTIAYAFAATPGGGNDCGKCYMLTFKGTGASATSTPTDDAHRSIKGKHLIVMASNIGYDVSHNQFDLMIPGGGPGAFNGCSQMGLSCAGASHGGFLTTCNYSKSCLIDMCNKEYANNTNMRNGCLFLANWMNAANNPEVKFVQVECPSALTAKY